MTTTEQIARALKNVSISEGQRKMLQIIYSNQTISVPDLAEAVGYKNYSGVNLQLGLLGRTICNELGTVPLERKADKPIWTFGLAYGERKGKPLEPREHEFGRATRYHVGPSASVAMKAGSGEIISVSAVPEGCRSASNVKVDIGFEGSLVVYHTSMAIDPHIPLVSSRIHPTRQSAASPNRLRN